MFFLDKSACLDCFLGEKAKTQKRKEKKKCFVAFLISKVIVISLKSSSKGTKNTWIKIL